LEQLLLLKQHLFGDEGSGFDYIFFPYDFYDFIFGFKHCTDPFEAIDCGR